MTKRTLFGACFFTLLFAAIAVAQGVSTDVVAVGKDAPPFELEDSKGNVFRLAKYRGEKAVVIEFFRSGGW